MDTVDSEEEMVDSEEDLVDSEVNYNDNITEGSLIN